MSSFQSPFALLRDAFVRGAASLRLSAAETAAVPCRLNEPGPCRTAPVPAYRTLAALVLLTLTLRAAMCYVIPTICVDGANYIAQAEEIERSGATLHLVYRLNLYPLILVALHGLGLSWEAAGTGLGVVCSTLAVVPLFGWVRRQFNDRIAVTACLLYASHPELIEWSPEMVRDPMFWLLCSTGTYVSWRAVTEVRLRYFFAAGLVLPAAVFTRFEGLLLLIPLVWWTAARLRALRTSRLRLTLGFALALSVAPLTAVLVNVVWYRQASIIDLVHSAPLERVQLLFRDLLGGGVTTEAFLTNQNGGDQVSPFAPAVVRQSARVVVRGLTEVFALLMLGGIIASRRRVRQCDCLPLFLTAVPAVAGVWIYQWYCGAASSRYVLAIVMLATPAAAIGLLRACDFLTWRASARPWRVWLAPAAVTTVVVVGSCDALSTQYESRAYCAKLGLEVRRNCGEGCLLAGMGHQLPLVAYYAHARVWPLTVRLEPALLVAILEMVHPDVVVVLSPPLTPDAYRAVAADGERRGLVSIEPPPQTKHRADVLVLARPGLRR